MGSDSFVAQSQPLAPVTFPELPLASCPLRLCGWFISLSGGLAQVRARFEAAAEKERSDLAR